MEQVIALAVLGTLASKIVDLAKFLRVHDWNAVITQVATWVAGIVVVMFGANADAFEALIIPGMDAPLGAMNAWSQILIGLTLTSFISFTYDFRKAFDNTDSAKLPQLTGLDLPDGQVNP